MSIKIIAVLDRFEDDQAVLLLGAESKVVRWPRELLPEGSREGEMLSVSLEQDKLANELARREVEELLRDLIAEHKGHE
jgi:hypothetical protein